jgi:sRNA-binding protein
MPAPKPSAAAKEAKAAEKATKAAAKAATAAAEKAEKAAAKEAEKAAKTAAKEAEKAAKAAAKKAEKPTTNPKPKAKAAAVAVVAAPVEVEGELTLVDGTLYMVKKGNVYEYDELAEVAGDFVGRMTADETIDTEAEEITGDESESE